MNTDKNSYTLIYATVMVVIAAVLLAGVSTALKGPQKANERIDKMEQILRSIGVTTDDNAQVPALYAEHIKGSIILGANGEVVQKIMDEVAGEADRAFNDELAEGEVAIYLAQKGDLHAYILPLSGAGLWGPIWGYIAIDAADRSTVVGIDLGNAGETPGLGAEMSTQVFMDRFLGKNILRDNTLRGIAIVKPGTTLADQDYVDGLSGGTITSAGIHDMLARSLAPYKPFLENANNAL